MVNVPTSRSADTSQPICPLTQKMEKISNVYTPVRFDTWENVVKKIMTELGAPKKSYKILSSSGKKEKRVQFEDASKFRIVISIQICKKSSPQINSGKVTISTTSNKEGKTFYLTTT